MFFFSFCAGREGADLVFWCVGIRLLLLLMWIVRLLGALMRWMRRGWGGWRCCWGRAVIGMVEGQRDWKGGLASVFAGGFGFFDESRSHTGASK